MMADTPAPRLVNGHYEVAGKHLPRVSTILDVLAKPGLEKWRLKIGAVQAEQVSRTARELGTRVHAALEQVNRYGKQIPSAEMTPFVEAYLDWFTANVAAVVSVEQVVYSLRDAYAGTCDLVADMRDGRRLLIDIKSSKSPDSSWPLQLSAYAFALAEMGTPVDGRLIVNLPSSEPGLLRVYAYTDDDRDMKAWRACVRLFHWQARHADDWKVKS